MMLLGLLLLCVQMPCRVICLQGVESLQSVRSLLTCAGLHVLPPIAHAVHSRCLRALAACLCSRRRAGRSNELLCARRGQWHRRMLHLKRTIDDGGRQGILNCGVNGAIAITAAGS
jgi:hypothetical protein